MKLVLASLFSVTACATAVPAAAPPLAPKIVAPLDSLAFYVGNWTCKGTTFPTADQKAETWDARIVVAPELDGTWLSVQMIGPGTNRTIEHKGYDRTTKKWMHLVAGVEGTWAVVSSPGWTGNQMMFDDPSDHSVATFTHIDDTHYSHSVAADAAHGGARQWEKVCTKA